MTKQDEAREEGHDRLLRMRRRQLLGMLRTGRWTAVARQKRSRRLLAAQTLDLLRRQRELDAKEGR